MPLYHDDDQAMLADTAAQFMGEEGAIAKQLRHWRDKGCKDGFGHALWKQMAEMGFTGILVPEADGGLGMGHVEAGIVLEEIGRNLTPSPFLTSSVMAATALGQGGDDLRARYLPGLLAGDSVFCGGDRRGGEAQPRPDCVQGREVGQWLPPQRQEGLCRSGCQCGHDRGRRANFGQ